MSSKSVPITLDDLETLAKENMPVASFGYISSGADAETTMQRNRAIYDELFIRPKVLIDVSEVTIGTTILGHNVDTPIGIAPTAFHGLAHEDGELATAKAAAESNICYCAATYSNYSMTEIMEEAKKHNDSPFLWFQLYVERDRATSEKLIKICEKIGYKALVVTVDRPRLGRRVADARNHFKLPDHLKLGNFEERGTEDAYFTGEIDAALEWDDIVWIKSITTLPVILKGVFRHEDAKKAVECGVDAIIVSNHGGRQLDGCPSTLEVLPEIVDACKGTKVEVYIDGGIRRGTDVFKALALGARAVFIGRPIVWGLSYKGAQGAKFVLNNLAYDLRLAMALAGTRTLKEITTDFVKPASFYKFDKWLQSKI